MGSEWFDCLRALREEVMNDISFLSQYMWFLFSRARESLHIFYYFQLFAREGCVSTSWAVTHPFYTS